MLGGGEGLEGKDKPAHLRRTTHGHASSTAVQLGQARVGKKLGTLRDAGPRQAPPA